jgi:hypothetical protein
MAEHAKEIDISGMPELLRLVEEVRASNEPRLLTRDHERLAVVMPVSVRPRSAVVGRRRPRRTSKPSVPPPVAGGVVDVDKLVKDIYESRRISTRPPVDL